jgi:amino acid adenylation domain-containing protein
VRRLAVAPQLGPDESGPALEPVQQAGDLAYVIFTSGSTGVPKGVMIEHAAAVNTIVDINERIQLRPQDRVWGLSSLSFDLSVYDLFGTLAAGATLVLPGPDAGRDPGQWLEWMEQTGVSVWNSVPALLEMLVEYAEGRQRGLPASLRVALLSGDWIPVSLPGRVRALRPEVALLSLGGATEAAIWSIYYPIQTVDRHWSSIPYGRPLSNQSFEVLNEAWEPCPDWVPGQLYIGGAGLARGYWRDGERTGEQFVAHPHSGRRLYRTGDLGRYLPDGNIEFLGREDLQVKVQGHRIELGEIEAALKRHPDVRDAVVIATGLPPGPRRLVAYVVPHAGTAPAPGDLQRFLVQSLPGYMVPAAFVRLAELPLGPTGKVQRKSLPPPEASESPAITPGANLNQLEEVISSLWAHVLEQDEIDRSESFFALGGDSITGVRLLSLVRNVFHVEVPLRRLFEEPTVKALARAVQTAAAPEAGDGPPLAPVPRPPEPPLSCAQEAMWFLCRMEPESGFYNLSSAFRLTGKLHEGALAQSLQALVIRHESLRTSFPAGRGKAVQFIHAGAELPLSVLELDGRPLADAAALASALGAAPFDLSRAPLARAALLRLAPEDNILVISVHHIISDARSIELLLGELASVYSALTTGPFAELPELGLQYADFACWQARCLEQGLHESQIAWWRRQLAGAPEPMQLAALASGGSAAGRSITGSRFNFSLSFELSARLHQLARGEGATLFMTLLAAFSVLLHQRSRACDLIVSTSISGRRGGSSEGVVGCFLNTLLLRIGVAPSATFRELLQRVREVAAGAYANQDVPFEHVIKSLFPGRGISYTPVSRVAFGLRSSQLEEIRLPGLVTTAIELERHTAKFDLELQMLDRKRQITGFFDYNARLFKARDVACMAVEYQTLLSLAAENPETKVEALVEQIDALNRQTAVTQDSGAARRGSFRDARPKPVPLSAADLVRTSSLDPRRTLPLLIEATGREVDLRSYVATHRQYLEEQLANCGGILFRNFAVASVENFQEIVNALSDEILEYVERSTPRSTVSGKVYTSTEYPADQLIPLHNENSYASVWPLKIWFFCLQPAEEGGETIIADSRKVFERLDPALRDEFTRRKLTYVRNYWHGISPSWQEAFGTPEREAVEKYCHSAGIAFQWAGQGRLCTRQTSEAVAVHPRTREALWFNQAHLFHPSSLPDEVRQSLSAVFGDELPRSVHFGDGGLIEDSALAAIRAAYDAETVQFRWCKGDLLLLDNMLTTHGRTPFKGQRKVVVAMAEPWRTTGNGKNE